MIEYNVDPVDLTHIELQPLTEKERAILLLGCGGNSEVTAMHYDILDSGVRECFTRSNKGSLQDWSSEFTLAFGGTVLWNLHFNGVEK